MIPWSQRFFLIFLRERDEQTISTWVVKSHLLIGVKLKHVLTMGDKSPGIRKKKPTLFQTTAAGFSEFINLKINIGRRRKMQAAPKMITYLYKVVCFFSYKETFIPYSEIYILLP